MGDSAASKMRAPAVEGWFTIEDEPALVGTRCRACGSVFFPPETALCRNPRCASTELDETRLSRRGRIWSYTDARYQPPPPYIPRREPFEPFALAAVELEGEGLVVLGQVADGYGVHDLAVGTPVELVVEPLYDDGDTTYLTWRWKPLRGRAGRPVRSEDAWEFAAERTHTARPPDDAATASRRQGALSAQVPRRWVVSDVVVLGVGMHPWGKWGRSFVSYGVQAARAALADAGIDWADVDLVVGGETVRNGYAGYVAGATFAQALGWSGATVATAYAACATGAQALDVARARILAGLTEVALVVGADTTPKGFLAPNTGERRDDPDWLRFRLLGMTNPAYFGLYARRRMAVHGATPDDFALVKAKNSRHGLANPNARYRKAVTVDDVLASPVVADPLHLLDICATSDGGAAVVLGSTAAAKRHGIDSPVRLRAVSTVTPTFPNTVIEMPNFATDPQGAVPPPERTFRDSIAHAAYEEAGLGAEDMSLAEVYDLSTALELDWYENIGLCKPGEAERLLRDGDTTIGGRIPVNPSGGLACFGEAVPAQALAQVCEVVDQLRGRAPGRQIEGARAGITANQGLFGHGSSVILSL
jgi:acetyl-CoA acetyltransferase/uncharacterized OB-fold protein